MDVVQVKLKVITDNSGDFYSIPALLTENGIYTPLVDYFLKKHQVRSRSWLLKVTYSIKIFMQYIATNINCFEDSHILLQNFTQRLCSGTISETGEDPSGLFWLPKRTRNANTILTHISNFSDWLAESQGTVTINPRTEKIDTLERRMAFAAWYNKNQSQFLGHLQAKKSSIYDQRQLTRYRQPVNLSGDAIAFDDSIFQKFLLDGVASRADSRAAIRDCLIIILMHGAGVRVSDAMNLWISDVYQHPTESEQVLVRLYHPEHGRAPDLWKSPSGDTHRAAYLKYKYNLTPRIHQYGSGHLGWKNVVVDHADNYIQLHWFPSFYGELFKKLWVKYLGLLVQTSRKHPYAFVSFHKSNIGTPYTINAFNDNYRSAIRRIGLTPSKQDGLSPHAHRHSYGRRLAAAKIDPLYVKRALHHNSIASQNVYTELGVKQVSELLSSASKELEIENKNKHINKSLDWKLILSSGYFDDSFQKKYIRL